MQRPVRERALEGAALDHLVLRRVTEAGERLRQRFVAAVLGRRGEDARACGRGERHRRHRRDESPREPPRRMSPFIEKVPSIGLPAPKVGALGGRHDQTGVYSRRSPYVRHTTPALDAATERRIEESLERRQRTLDRRELLGTLVLTAGFLAGAIALALFATPARELSLPVALAFVVAYRGRRADRVHGGRRLRDPDAARVRADAAPAADAAGAAARRARQRRPRRSGTCAPPALAPGRVLFAPGDAAFALAPGARARALGGPDAGLGAPADLRRSRFARAARRRRRGLRRPRAARATA